MDACEHITVARLCGAPGNEVLRCPFLHLKAQPPNPAAPAATAATVVSPPEIRANGPSHPAGSSRSRPVISRGCSTPSSVRTVGARSQSLPPSRTRTPGTVATKGTRLVL